MKKNIGTADRAIRVTGGLVILLIGLYFQSWWGLLGIIPIVTGLVRFCPAYYPFGISTIKKEQKRAEKVVS